MPYMRRGIITYPESLLDIQKLFRILERTFQISKLALLYVSMLGTQVFISLAFSIQCFEYHISDIVSSIQKAFPICYGASPKNYVGL